MLTQFLNTIYVFSPEKHYYFDFNAHFNSFNLRTFFTLSCVKSIVNKRKTAKHT